MGRRWQPLLWGAAIAVGALAVTAVTIMAFRSSGVRDSMPSPENLESQEASDFTLRKLDGGEVTLSDFRGQKNVLLFFNEGYGCAPCWQQAVELQKNLQEFTDLNTEVFAIMVDPPDLLEQEASRWDLTLPILVDEDRHVAKAYDALGGMHADKPNHTFVFIDQEGVVRWSQDYPSMWVENDSVLEQVSAITG